MLSKLLSQKYAQCILSHWTFDTGHIGLSIRHSDTFYTGPHSPLIWTAKIWRQIAWTPNILTNSSTNDSNANERERFEELRSSPGELREAWNFEIPKLVGQIWISTAFPIKSSRISQRYNDMASHLGVSKFWNSKSSFAEQKEMLLKFDSQFDESPAHSASA